MESFVLRHQLTVDKGSFVPLYLQLKDQIKQKIHSNKIKARQYLPSISSLAEELSINLATVRKAYKELEKEGLVVIQKAKGTYVSSRPMSPLPPELPEDPATGMRMDFRKSIRHLVRNGVPHDEFCRECRQIWDDVLDQEKNQYVIFTECNHYQLDLISPRIHDALRMRVVPKHISELTRELAENKPLDKYLKAVITTDFHIDEVYQALGPRPMNIHILKMSLSPAERKKINGISSKALIVFISDKKRALPVYKKWLTGQFGKKFKMQFIHLEEKQKRILAFIEKADALFVAPSVHDKIKDLLAGKNVFNVLDQIDPGSLEKLKAEILSL